MKNLNEDLQDIIDMHNISDEHAIAVELNEKCLVSMRLRHGYLKRDENGYCIIAEYPTSSWLNLAFLVTEDTEAPKGYQFMYQTIEINTQDEFIKQMSIIKDQAKMYLERGVIKLELNQ